MRVGWLVGCLAVLASGCDGDDGEGPPVDEVEVVSAGSCEVEAGEAVAFETVLSARYGCAPPAAPTSEVITTEARWVEWRDEADGCLDEGVELGEVDFATSTVLVAGAGAFATSGFTVHDVSVAAGPGGAHLEAVFTDPYGACETQPGMAEAWVVAVAVATADAGAPTVCRRTRRVCGSE